MKKQQQKKHYQSRNHRQQVSLLGLDGFASTWYVTVKGCS